MTGNPGTFFTVSWVLASAWITCCGWGLSILGIAYGTAWRVALLVGAVGFAIWLWRERSALISGWWRRVLRRAREPLPAAWFALWLLAVFGGALHAPNNVDALTYRLPRVLHWLFDGGWQWLATNDERMNYSATGMEWQMSAIIALFGSLRPIFLLNALPALLFPGLAFSFFRRVGVARRVARRWMWVLPLGHVFMLQAGGIGNDSNGALYFLAAAHFLSLGRVKHGNVPLGLGGLAAALLTGWKSSNVPLLIPLAAMAWAERVRFRVQLRPVRLIAWGLLALGSSALPLLVLNQMHSGHWSGDPLNVTEVRLTSPVAGWVGNGVQAVAQNLLPPVFPSASAWNEWCAENVEPRLRLLALGSEFSRFTLRAGELAQEEWAGVGLLLVLLAIGGMGRPDRLGRSVPGLTLAGIGAVVWLFAGLGSEMTARLLAPYYPVLFVPLLVSVRQKRWTQSGAWNVLAGLNFAALVLLLVVGPARPLLPMGALAEKFAGPDSRIATVYAVYEMRADPLATLRNLLPREAEVVGFLASADDAEISFWLPLGHRRVVRLVAVDDPRIADLTWIAVRADFVWPGANDEAAWLRRWRGSIIVRANLRAKASRPIEEWVLVRLIPTDTSAAR